ncbi:DUF6122 family protein [Flavobacteriaceae bacterium LMO-SS05]
MVQPLLHYGIHLGLPLLIALFFFKSNWKVAYLIMLAGLLIDVDHLLAHPMFDPNRCSINFHPLHSYYAMAIYMGLALFKKTRILGIGLIIHIIADTVDCLLM